MPFHKKELKKIKGLYLRDRLEDRYGEDFGVKSDEELGDYLKKKGYPALYDLLKGK